MARTITSYVINRYLFTVTVLGKAMYLDQTMLQKRIREQRYKQFVSKLLATVAGCGVLAIAFKDTTTPANPTPIVPILSTLDYSPDFTLLRPPVSLEDIPLEGI